MLDDGLISLRLRLLRPSAALLGMYVWFVILGRVGLARIVACGLGASSSTLVLGFHLGLFAAEELVSPPDKLDRDGERRALLLKVEEGGGLERKGNIDESLFFFSFPTSIAAGGAAEETADILFPIGLNGLLGGGLGAPGALFEVIEDVVEMGTGLRDCGEEMSLVEVLRLGVSFPTELFDRTLAVTLEANRLRGDMLLEKALGVPELLPALLRAPDAGVDK